jgi:hypothetical protein
MGTPACTKANLTRLACSSSGRVQFRVGFQYNLVQVTGEDHLVTWGHHNCSGDHSLSIASTVIRRWRGFTEEFILAIISPLESLMLPGFRYEDKHFPSAPLVQPGEILLIGVVLFIPRPEGTCLSLLLTSTGALDRPGRGSIVLQSRVEGLGPFR